MNKTLNTQIVLEHKLDAEAVDFIERMVAAGHEINLTDGGPQPIFTIGAGKAPISGKTAMEIAKWAPKEHLLIKAFRVLSTYYPNGMSGRGFDEELAVCRARLGGVDEALGERRTTTDEGPKEQ